jgi:hypothetical protein
MALKPDHAKLAGYFNVDNGTGLIRGVYLQGNEAVAPIFQQWMEPFKNLGMTTLTIRNTGTDPVVRRSASGTVHQDEWYNSRTHHSNMDVYGASGQRHDAQRGDRRDVRDEHGEPRRQAAAQPLPSRRRPPAAAPRSRRGGHSSMADG